MTARTPVRASLACRGRRARAHDDPDRTDDRRVAGPGGSAVDPRRPVPGIHRAGGLAWAMAIRRASPVVVATLTFSLAACTAQPPTRPQTPPPTTPTTSVEPVPAPTADPTSRTNPPVATPHGRPFDVDRVLGGIRDLAAIGPRDAASPASDRAAAYVAARLRSAGYRVTLQPFTVPAGVSWGVRVPAGTTVNVVAEPPGFDPRAPHVVVGAHLDTVPQAPGAEDNASGLMVLTEVARMLHEQPGSVPVRFVAFGAEEARGGNGTRYAFGSRHFVAALDAAGRKAVRGMLALDRVGVRAAAVPVCSGGRGTPSLARAVRSAASASPAPVPTRGCTNRASDHVSFEAVGIPAVRLGSVPYAAYHSARDVPSVVDRGQLARSGAVVWAWLRSLR